VGANSRGCLDVTLSMVLMKVITAIRILRRDVGSSREIVSRNSASMTGLFGECGRCGYRFMYSIGLGNCFQTHDIVTPVRQLSENL
jgi:hypothetical protein